MKYVLNDLAITTIGEPATFNCSHTVGDGFEIRGENLYFNKQTKYFSHYVMAALTPYIAAKQRSVETNDWMQYEQEIACPDPKCGARFHFSVTGRTEYDHTPIN